MKLVDQEMNCRRDGLGLSELRSALVFRSKPFPIHIEEH